MPKKLTTEEFIEKAKKVHGELYDYSNTVYINSETKVSIFCKTHGVFEQRPDKHLQGRKCKICSKENISKNLRYTSEQFIEKAKDKHGCRYDYSKVDYINTSTNVIITCDKHGDFYQQPNNHLFGQGCPKCGLKKASKTKTRTKEEFIKKANEVHSNTFDYSITNYTNCKDKVEILCKIHGVFKVTPDNHLCGDGCKTCNKEKLIQKNTDNFLNKAKVIHNNKFDYSLVNYKNNISKVKIICPIHGEFEQLPLCHLQGNGCNKCNLEKRTNEKLNTEDFILGASNTHNNKYNYNNIEVDGWNSKVEIVCPIHGIFYKNATKHLNGEGCQKCSKTKRGENLASNKAEFIKKAKNLHGDRYNYDEVEYIQSKKKVKIKCEIHGVFEQTPTTHLKGSGCKECANLLNVYKKEDYVKLSENALLYLVLLESENEKFYKIGKTKNTVKERFNSDITNFYKYNVITEYFNYSGTIFDLEIELHKKYYKYKYKPNNWFPGHTECYNLNLPIEEIINL